MGYAIKLGNQVRVSDPCYGTKVWCAGVIDNVKPGIYNVIVEYKNARVSKLMVKHSDYDNVGFAYSKQAKFEVGVDSGQAGIYDNDYYNKYHTEDRCDDTWYEEVCKLTLSEEKYGTKDTSCAVSESGYGDGSYTCYLDYDGEQVIGICIDFCMSFFDNEDDEEVDEDYSETEDAVTKSAAEKELQVVYRVYTLDSSNYEEFEEFDTEEDAIDYAKYLKETNEVESIHVVRYDYNDKEEETTDVWSWSTEDDEEPKTNPEIKVQDISNLTEETEVNIENYKEEINVWANDDWNEGKLMDPDDFDEFAHILVDSHSELAGKESIQKELWDYYWESVDNAREWEY